MRQGFVLPMWSDLKVNVGQKGSFNYSWLYSDTVSNATSHEQEQRGNFLPNESFLHLKLHCPWTAVCKEDIEWSLIQPSWHNESPFDYVTPPGVVNFKFQHSLEVHTFFERKENNNSIIIPHNRPMLQAIPHSNRDIHLNYHLVSEKDWIKYSSQAVLLKFSHGYNMVKKIRKENGGCPFHRSK